MFVRYVDSCNRNFHHILYQVWFFVFVYFYLGIPFDFYLHFFSPYLSRVLWNTLVRRSLYVRCICFQLRKREMSTDDTQQFCLRWHNYQSTLLSTLPQLLDGDDLTDVTLCAGNRSLKAHRVVLSACSEYFKELFKVCLSYFYCNTSSLLPLILSFCLMFTGTWT